MKKTAVLFSSIFMLSLSIINCSDKKTGSQVDKKSAIIVDTSFLADKNFIYKNLTNTIKVNFIGKNAKGGGLDLSNLYTDSSFKKVYFQLSGDQEGFLIAPFLPKDYGVKYVKKEMWTWLVSKQNKIGDFQPIIVLEIGKADYESLTLIVLDKKNKPVSNFSLDEENPTYNDIGYPHKTNNYSVLNKNEIISYRISKNTDSIKKQITIDSNVFKSVINENVTISTKQIGKSHFNKSLK